MYPIPLWPPMALSMSVAWTANSTRSTALALRATTVQSTRLLQSLVLADPTTQKPLQFLPVTALRALQGKTVIHFGVIFFNSLRCRYYCPSPCLAPIICDSSGWTSGSYCPQSSASPQPCPAGCRCPKPYDRAYICDPSFYCPISSEFQIPCPSGNFCPSANLTAPIPCPPGFFCNSSCTQPASCPIGSFCPGSSTQPIPCSKNQYTPSGRF